MLCLTAERLIKPFRLVLHICYDELVRYVTQVLRLKIWLEFKIYIRGLFAAICAFLSLLQMLHISGTVLHQKMLKNINHRAHREHRGLGIVHSMTSVSSVVSFICHNQYGIIYKLAQSSVNYCNFLVLYKNALIFKILIMDLILLIPSPKYVTFTVITKSQLIMLRRSQTHRFIH